MRNWELTENEIRVLRQMARGLTEKEAGAETFHSKETIHCHTKSIRQKLQARNTTNAVAIGFARGLLTEADLTSSQKPALLRQR